MEGLEELSEMAYTDKPRLPSGFKVSAESGTTRPSRIRLDTCRDETDTRYGIMNELDWELVRLD